MTVVAGAGLGEGHDDAAIARLAGRIAVAGGDDLVLVHVSTDPRAEVVLGTGLEGLLAGTRAALEQLAEGVRVSLPARVSADLWAGSVPESLCAAAESFVARALLLGHRPSRGAATAERVIREASSPVLVARNPARLERWLEGARPLRVLVGSDTGESATRAMRFVAGLQGMGPLETEVVCVADPIATTERYGLVPSGGAFHPDAEAHLRRDLEAQAARAGLPNATVRVRPGSSSPETHLAVLAEDLEADLVAVGVRRRSWIEEVWYGSVARGVLRGVATNVACVPAGLLEAREAPRPLPTVIVAATDLTPVGNSALPVAYGYVAEGGTVHLVHVVEGERVPVPGARVVSFEVDRRLRERVPPGADARRVETVFHVVGGDTAAAIVSLAERVGADAIAVASVGRGALGAAAFGSVSRDLVALARCPVLVIPAAKE